MSAAGQAYFVDIVLCIDCTGSMSPVLNDVKEHALQIHSAITNRMAEKRKGIDKLRIRVIAFKDYFADSDPMNSMGDFVELPANVAAFETFVRGLGASGGGDEPESGLEALALALKSNWNNQLQSKGRRVVVVWTDASAHSLEKGVTANPSGYPQGLPKSLDELTECWHAMPPQSRRLLLYAPDAEPWSIIGATWDQTIHFPSQAGKGLAEVEFTQILDAIANSI